MVLSFTGFYWLDRVSRFFSMGFTWFQGDGCYWFSMGFTGFLGVSWGFPRFYWVLLDYT